MKAETKHLRAQLGIEVTPDTEDSDLIHIRASDESIDRYGEIITAAGWRLDHYQSNPIIQNAHQYGDIMFTIGRAEKTLVSQNALLQTWRFASAANPFAKVARDLYRGGFLRAASVGFLPLRWEDGTEKSAFRRKYLEQELLEVSAVSIPANPNALTLALNRGAVQKSDLRELNELITCMLRSPRCEEGDLLVPPSEVSESSAPKNFLTPAMLSRLESNLRSLRHLLK